MCKAPITEEEKNPSKSMKIVECMNGIFSVINYRKKLTKLNIYNKNKNLDELFCKKFM